MAKAPRDKESAAPKKRNPKVTPGNGNGVHAENGNGAVATPVKVSTEISSETQFTPNLDEQIRARAYELYLQRGESGGSPEQDWLRAIEEIRGR
ncbi:MAG TPA: DUF2934 domain-containing protein [Terriglobales bacterium]|jgi:hypothetical protein